MLHKRYRNALMVAYLWLLSGTVSCTDPDMEVSAVVHPPVEVDSLTSEVVFEGRAGGPFWWRLELRDGGWLFDYGEADVAVMVPVVFSTGFRFWMEFVVWSTLDTARVTFMNVPPR